MVCLAEHVLDNGDEGVIALCKRSAHSACFLASVHIDRAVKHQDRPRAKTCEMVGGAVGATVVDGGGGGSGEG